MGAIPESDIVDMNWHIEGNSLRSRKSIDKNPKEFKVLECLRN